MKPPIKKAIKIAKASPCFQRHSALVFKGGALVAWAHNSPEVHAEVAALKKLWPSKRKGTTVVCLRITRAGEVGLSAPCIACEQFLREAKVKNCYYTDSGILQLWRVN